MYVCLCMAITDRAILRSIEEGAGTIREVSRRTGAGIACGGCRPAILALLRDRGGKVEGTSAEVVPLRPSMEGGGHER